MPFDALPPGCVAAIEARTGPIREVSPVAGGYNSQVAARIRCPGGTYFVKGLHAGHRRVWTQRREAEMNPHLDGLGPGLVARVDGHGWDVLVFEALDGRHADFTRGSADLPAVAGLLARLAATRCPDVDVRPMEDRLLPYVARPADAQAFAGDALVHSDPNDTNVIVSGTTARLVDWAWASRGAPWLDAAYWVIWLIAAGGHDPASAEEWAARVPPWRQARPAAVTAFAQAKATYWRQVAGGGSDALGARMLGGARWWAGYRVGGA
jgi:hypothetical protein